MPEATQIPRQSLHDALTPSLRGMILGGELKPGAKIPERQLCERFGVSRTPLREALKVLAAEGLIELLPQRGAIVAQISAEDIEELFPIMAALEALAGELACERATDADIARIRALHDQMMESYRIDDEDNYLRLNRLVHEAIFDIARNDTLAAMYQQILMRIHAHRFIVRKSEANWKSAVEEHEQIMEALAARDKRRLSRLLRKHVTGTTARIARESVERAEAKP
ncbi:GntR family transcriptional regulator [Sphingomonas oleivorans]|uniref:GntR family transcriptional regulator n=1 Tax=Sphingomonas oleivorans TaxID=1735121 RepID=A0A2T5G1L3_9SPHN|nr:GntR family transcriptional regulator [Sphingomonas oleivorans]PTQ13034.1 GntR family transcriptional regulator [Sphingomonas oleivorans]